MKSDLLRKILYSAAFVGYLSWTAAPPVAAAATSKSYDWCYETCGPEESCGIECENDGGGTITCGDYHDGPENDWCLEECSEVCTIEETCGRECLQTGWASDCEDYNGGVCSNTCETTCNAMTSSGSEACYDNGGDLSTCGDYGKYLACGDGICAYGEVCVCQECAAHCPAPESVPSIVTDKIPTESVAVDSDFGEACEAAVTTEWAAGWSCAEWSEELNYPELPGQDPEHPLCDALMEDRETVAEMLRQAETLEAQLEAANPSCPTPPDTDGCKRLQQATNKKLELWSKYNALNALPCYIDYQ